MGCQMSGFILTPWPGTIEGLERVAEEARRDEKRKGVADILADQRMSCVQ